MLRRAKIGMWGVVFDFFSFPYVRLVGLSFNFSAKVAADQNRPESKESANFFPQKKP